MKLKHIQQHSENDCAVAAAAVVAGTSYKRAAKMNPIRRIQSRVKGLTVPEIRYLVYVLTGKLFKLTIDTAHPPITSLTGKGPYLVLSRKGWRDHDYHWIVIADGIVFDPGRRIRLSFDKYGQDQKVWAVLTPPE